MSDAKFAVGEWVTTVSPYYGTNPAAIRLRNGEPEQLRQLRVPLQIIERMIQTCPGGTQIHYKCRPHFIEMRNSSAFRGEVYWTSFPGAEIRSFNEIEVEAYTEEMEKANAEIATPEIEETEGKEAP